jgi:hypothetical protein
MTNILVQMAEENWTMQALHLACALARNSNSKVVLLQLMQVKNPSLLGASFDGHSPSEREYADLEEYAATAEDYGVELELQPMQCISMLDAVVDAAEQLNTVVVFAHVLPSRIPYWRRFQVWNLERRLRNQRQQLFTLDQPLDRFEWTPSITVTAVAPVVKHATPDV